MLRRDLGPLPASAVGTYAVAVAVCVGLVAWHARDPRLAAYVIGAGAATVAALCALAWVLIRLLNRLRRQVGTAWRFGLANITRRARGSVMQMVAFGLGIMMLLLISLVRGDLLAEWQRAAAAGRAQLLPRERAAPRDGGRQAAARRTTGSPPPPSTPWCADG